MLIDNETTGENLTETVNVSFEKTSDGQNLMMYVGDYCVGLTENEIKTIMNLYNDANLSRAHQRET